MEVKILKPFRDRYSKVLYSAGDVIDMAEDRFSQVNSTRHGKLAEKVKAAPKNKKRNDSIAVEEITEEGC